MTTLLYAIIMRAPNVDMKACISFATPEFFKPNVKMKLASIELIMRFPSNPFSSNYRTPVACVGPTHGPPAGTISGSQRRDNMESTFTSMRCFIMTSSWTGVRVFAGWKLALLMAVVF